MLIIPRTPSPPPVEERDPDSLSRKEIMELQNSAKDVKVRPRYRPFSSDAVH